MYAFYIFGNWNCTDCSFHSQAQDEIKLLCYANIRNICIAISSRNLSVIAFCVCAWRTYSELRKGGLEQIGYYLQWQHICLSYREHQEQGFLSAYLYNRVIRKKFIPNFLIIGCVGIGIFLLVVCAFFLAGLLGLGPVPN